VLLLGRVSRLAANDSSFSCHQRFSTGSVMCMNSAPMVPQ
jgi:hypothetical protein